MHACYADYIFLTLVSKLGKKEEEVKNEGGASLSLRAERKNKSGMNI